MGVIHFINQSKTIFQITNLSVGEDDPQARNILAELESYAKFSFFINGLMTW